LGIRIQKDFRGLLDVLGGALADEVFVSAGNRGLHVDLRSGQRRSERVGAAHRGG
jgi:hypothetical protein